LVPASRQNFFGAKFTSFHGDVSPSFTQRFPPRQSSNSMSTPVVLPPGSGADCAGTPLQPAPFRTCTVLSFLSRRKTLLAIPISPPETCRFAVRWMFLRPTPPPEMDAANSPRPVTLGVVKLGSFPPWVFFLQAFVACIVDLPSPMVPTLYRFLGQQPASNELAPLNDDTPCVGPLSSLSGREGGATLCPAQLLLLA